MNWLKEVDYGLVLPALARMPTGLAYRMADLRGEATFLLRRQACRAAQRNLQATFPELDPAQARRTIRRQCRVLSRDEMESYWFNRPLSFFEPRIRIRGLEELRTGVESGRSRARRR